MLLTSGNDSIRIDPSRGGRVTAFSVSGLDIIVSEDADPLAWGCYPMVPWAGRVRGGQFTWENLPVQLPVRMPPHAIHGTVLDRAWRATTGTGGLESPLGDEWPWRGTARSDFQMSEGRFRWELTVSSKEHPMPAMLGWHPWFRKRLEDGSHATLAFDARSIYLRDTDGIPTGLLDSPSPGPWDDCFTAVQSAPRIHWSNGLVLEVSSTCDHWVIYDEPDHALCIEPQSGPPDVFNQGEPDVVQPGFPLVHAMTWRWWRESENPPHDIRPESQGDEPDA